MSTGVWPVASQSAGFPHPTRKPPQESNNSHQTAATSETMSPPTISVAVKPGSTRPPIVSEANTVQNAPPPEEDDLSLIASLLEDPEDVSLSDLTGKLFSPPFFFLNNVTLLLEYCFIGATTVCG